MPPPDQVLRADAARNYERIVVAAERAFEEIGPAATLEEVARRAGVGVATVYRRFRNRDQLVRAVFARAFVAIELAAVETDDPWQDLLHFLHATVDVLAGRQAVLALAREVDSIDVRLLDRCEHLVGGLLRRARAAGVTRPELEPRDVAAVVVMALAVVRPDDVGGADRRRYLALLTDGLRPAPTALPPAATLPSRCRA
ncbi:AcrR family transcriptional regulator [Actinoalloteichus hoggarensis]|uniref:Transcriptional regulator, TetR family n=1 Tax=Actinoalloteichus hoggarensis TaxID=1470176 RepID=A0A221VZ16_9PSEU|nr:TetR/AcrR family transcriptional regulator [Actinoalloteichus hoggarensis]ASO18783.1 Transcriptional regulator, TetR family [Actinoalloteichus hoggarensis]MBB5920015.1 AcrR family transcriptional regulator [Actinoalloteichus hoggarensis]